MSRAALTALMLVIFPASAAAGEVHEFPANPDPTVKANALFTALPKAQQAAESYWPQDACTGRVLVFPMTAQALIAARHAETITAGIQPAWNASHVAEDANTATCVIRIALDRMTGQADLCAKLVHGRGHLHGAPFPGNPADPVHSQDPRHVMALYSTTVPVRCLQAFLPGRVRTLRRRGYRCVPRPVNGRWRCSKARRTTYVDAG